MQNTTPDDLGADITGAQNMFRLLGGSIALMACGTIQNSLTPKLLLRITALTNVEHKLNTSSWLGTTATADVRAAVGMGVHAVFISFLLLIALSFINVCLIPVGHVVP